MARQYNVQDLQVKADQFDQPTEHEEQARQTIERSDLVMTVFWGMFR